MKTIDEIRHENLLRLIARMGSIQALATRVGKSHSQISQLKTRAAHSSGGKKRSIGDALARDIESQCELPVGWFDADHSREIAESVEPATASAHLPRLTKQSAPHPDSHIRTAIELLESLDRDGRAEAVGAIRVIVAAHHKSSTRSAGNGN
ncbi:MAG: hypothetical protein ACN6OP_04480 [Pseudomonadales bacterium]|uniref:hypothetical protein n=1 Tax=Cupriavidus sp. TaxID=1873897 RepID=UPI003D0BDD18